MAILLSLCVLGACKNYRFDIEPDGGDGSSDAGGDAMGDVATDVPTVPSIQLIGPISGSRATSTRPMFRWQLHADVQMLHCFFYTDASAMTPVLTIAFDGLTTSVTPGQTLPPGAVFWQLTAMDSSGQTVRSPIWEVFVPVPPPMGSPARVPGANPGPLDFNFDGHPDLAVAPQGGTAGVVVYQSSNVTNAASMVQLQGATGPVGTTDVDGDGPTDLIALLAGNLVVYRGQQMGASTTPSQTIPLPSDTHGVVNSIAGVGDVDGDGYGDVVLGSGSTGSSANAAYLYRGGPSGLSMTPDVTLDSPDHGGSFGAYVTAGDFDNDGLTDIVVGEPTYGSNQGRVFVYQGATGGPMPTVNHMIDPPTAATFFGVLGRVGDVNGDGFADLVVGAPGSGGTPGCVVAAMGGMSGLSPPGMPACAGTGVHIGVSITSAGDLDRDGTDDVLAGTLSANVTAFMGSTGFAPTITSANPTFADPAMNLSANFADSVSYVGDMDASGLTWFAVGAPDAPQSGTTGNGPGAAYLYRFVSATVVTNAFIPSPSSGASLFGLFLARWFPSLDARPAFGSALDSPSRWTPPPALQPVI